MRYYNPYHFVYFIPLALIAGLVYYLISFGRDLSTTSFIAIILVIFGALTFLGYHISKRNQLLPGRHRRGEVEDIVQKVIENKKGKITKDEIYELKSQIKAIYNSSYRRAERTMRLKELIDEYSK
jgi:hypothetical protein